MSIRYTLSGSQKPHIVGEAMDTVVELEWREGAILFYGLLNLYMQSKRKGLGVIIITKLYILFIYSIIRALPMKWGLALS